MSKYLDLDYNQSKLTGSELNKRCHQVFLSQSKDVYCSVHVNSTCDVEVTYVDHDYVTNEPHFDMTDRPTALDYILGNRDDFHD